MTCRFSQSWLHKGVRHCIIEGTDSIEEHEAMVKNRTTRKRYEKNNVYYHRTIPILVFSFTSKLLLRIKISYGVAMVTSAETESA